MKPLKPLLALIIILLISSISAVLYLQESYIVSAVLTIVWVTALGKWISQRKLKLNKMK
jgi:hypothetical protein